MWLRRCLDFRRFSPGGNRSEPIRISAAGWEREQAKVGEREVLCPGLSVSAGGLWMEGLQKYNSGLQKPLKAKKGVCPLKRKEKNNPPKLKVGRKTSLQGSFLAQPQHQKWF